jgi:hypothetical protein
VQPIFFFDLRVMAASVIAFAAASKLLQLDAAVAANALLHRRFGARPTVVIIAAVATAELIAALLIVFVPLNATVLSLSIVVAGVTFTVYALLSIRSTGSCGCTSNKEDIAPRTLMGRNFAVFSAAAVGVAIGPTFHTLSADEAASLSLVPWAVGAIVCGARFLRSRNRDSGEWRGIRARFDVAHMTD